MVQIDFFDSDTVKTLVPVKTLRPDKLYFLIAKGKEKSRKARQTAKAISAWGYGIQVEFVPVSENDWNDISSKIMYIMSKTDDEVYVDITGGSEIMVACGKSAASGGRAKAVFADMSRDVMIDVSTGNILSKLSHIGINDYVTAINARRMGNSRALPHPSEYTRICNVAETVFRDVTAWKALNSHIANEYPYQSSQSFKVAGRLERESREILSAMCKNGFIEYRDGAYYHKSKKYKSYVYNYGIWLELYVYIKAKQVFSQVGMGFVIDWVGDDGVNTEDNEIDVIVLDRSVPFFISCKMTKPEAMDVYEVGFLAKRFGGSNARYAMATTFPVTEFSAGNKGMLKRIRKMNCGLIETGAFSKERPQSVFRKAMSATE